MQEIINIYVCLKIRIIVFCIFISLFAPAVFSQEPQYGLKFNSNTYEPEMRTGLNLSPDDYLSFSDGFSMAFNAKFHFKDIHNYGYIFRIINEKGNSIDLIMGDINVVFSMLSGDIVCSNTLAEVDMIPEQWMPIRLNIDIGNEELEIKIGKYVKKWNTPEIRKFCDVKIMFGKTDYLKKQAIDVPDMTIKDLEIRDMSKKLQYSWKLSKHTSGGVYDDVKYYFAKCENPNWVLDYNGTWEKRITFTTGISPYLTYDFDKNIVTVADQRSFYIFTVKDNLFEKHTVNKKLSYKMSSNQMIYNPLDSGFYAYNLIKEDSAKEFVRFNLDKREWGATTVHEHTTDYRHHNRYFSPKYNRLYIFGGYGHLKYKGGVFIYDVKDKTWSKTVLKGDSIAPRYLGGMGEIDEDHLLLFGGYGSETGDQALQPQFYYDSYIINLKTMEAKKIWTLENPLENFVVSNSLVVDSKNKCFYALGFPSMKYNSHISLYKFSLEKPEYEIMADQIPIKFKDVFSYVDLFYDVSDKKLIAATVSPIADTTSNISIYSLAFPPLKNSDLYQSETKETNISLFILPLLFFIFLLSALYFVWRKRKNINTEQHQILDEKTEFPVPHTGVNMVRILPKKSIILFGGFQVVDKQGIDITSDFKPLLKNLFLLIFLHTIKNGKGISFTRLKDILWFDKSEESANNNRGVALSKIRQILDNVGVISFNKKGIYWSVEFGDDVYCDYYEALILMEKIKGNDVTISDIKRLLSIVSAGELLPNLQTEWIDAFKSDFSNELVDLILQLIRQKNIVFSDSLLIEMANALFIHDPLNEDALKLKCSVSVKMGKNGLARNAYNAFVKEYAVLFGTEYKYSFEQVIS